MQYRLIVNTETKNNETIHNVLFQQEQHGVILRHAPLFITTSNSTLAQALIALRRDFDASGWEELSS